MATHFAGDFAARMAEFRTSDEKRIEWMQNFAEQLSAREKQHLDTSRDLDMERESRRLKQQEVDKLKVQISDLQQSIDRSSFILVLVDADADSYINEYYKTADGGQKAVHDIRTRVKEYLDQENSELSSFPIVIKAFANEDGLSQLLQDAGIIRPPQSLLGFAKSFTQASDTADFLLVGSGKDRADKKIISVFKQCVDNPTCRHIIFGACHDNTYVRLLEDYAMKPSVINRVTLLNGFQVGREFGHLRFKSTEMSALFRDTPVKGGSRGSIDTAARSSLSEPKPESNTKNLTWATAVGAKVKGGDASGPILEMKKVPHVNKAGQRVDENLTEPSQQALDSWRHKTKVANMRYCRAYHLNSSCPGHCGYSHGPLTEEEKLVYRRKLRNEVCHAGLSCRDSACVYGHNCSCRKSNCKFPTEMHNISLV